MSEAISRRNGERRTNAVALITISITRLMSPRGPWNGVSHMATTGTPSISAVRDWIRSITKDIRHEVDRSGRVAQFVQQIHDALDLTHGKGDKDHVYFVISDICRQVREAAEQSLVNRQTKPFDASIVEKAANENAESAVDRQSTHQLATDVVVAGNDRPSRIARRMHEAPDSFIEQDADDDQRNRRQYRPGHDDEPGNSVDVLVAKPMANSSASRTIQRSSKLVASDQNAAGTHGRNARPLEDRRRQDRDQDGEDAKLAIEASVELRQPIQHPDRHEWRYQDLDQDELSESGHYA